jgi:hypothetical protein
MSNPFSTPGFFRTQGLFITQPQVPPVRKYKARKSPARNYILPQYENETDAEYNYRVTIDNYGMRGGGGRTQTRKPKSHRRKPKSQRRKPKTRRKKH